VRFALPLFIGLTVVLGAREILDPRPSPLLLSPELITSTVITGGLAALDLVLEKQRRDFSEAYAVSVLPAEGSTAVVDALFRLGKKYLARGEFVAALSVFEQTLTDNPQSVRTPDCLFESARINAITGNYEAAERYFTRIIDEYPVAALYDRTRKNLADLYVRQSEYRRALDELDAMVFADQGISREDIEAYRTEIRKKL
jgi:tetratricopeptide (TPR) repeat protein